MKGRVALSLTCLAALGGCDALSGSPYEIEMEIRDLDGPWMTDEEAGAMEAEFLAEWAEGPQCVEPSLFGGWKSIVTKIAVMGASAGCSTEVTRDDETGFGQILRCEGKGQSDFVSDGTNLTATTGASLDGDTIIFETRYAFGHETEPGGFAYTLAGTGRRVEACGI